jgi:hypothetical protein
LQLTLQIPVNSGDATTHIFIVYSVLEYNPVKRRNPHLADPRVLNLVPGVGQNVGLYVSQNCTE